MKSLYRLAFLLSIICYSCKQDDDNVMDEQAPSIAIISPAENFFYKPGDTVFIKANFTDNLSLRKGAVHIHDQFLESPADTVFNFSYAMKKTNFVLDTFWIVNDPLDKNYTIYIDATDNAENYTVRQRDFYQYH